MNRHFENHTGMPDADYATGLMHQLRIELPMLVDNFAAMLERSRFVISAAGKQPEVTEFWADMLLMLHAAAPELGLPIGSEVSSGVQGENERIIP